MVCVDAELLERELLEDYADYFRIDEYQPLSLMRLFQILWQSIEIDQPQLFLKYLEIRQ